MGEEVCGWVILRDPEEVLSSEELTSFCKDKIAHYKVPKNWFQAQEFPLTSTGKIQKTILRDMAAKEIAK
jgi:fatty-acyl-CoA synthase